MDTPDIEGAVQILPALEDHQVDPTTERVLIATDGGDAGESAVRWAANRSKLHRLDIDLISIIEVDPITKKSYGEQLHEEAEVAVDHGRKRLLAATPGSDIHTEVVFGDARSILDELSAEFNLLVVGSNRTGRLTGLLGSTFSVKVAESARCTVVVVPKNWSPSQGPVVVGIGMDDSDQRVLAYAVHEARVLHGPVRLVHALQLPAYFPSRASTGHGGDMNDIVERHTSALDDLVANLRAQNVDLEIEGVLSVDDAGEALRREAKGATMLVVGSHARSAVDRFFVGSVSRDILWRPPCPIAVVRAHEPESASPGSASGK
ncbi:universal stress protein [Mycetocola miduiensis]|uniref:Nucleotide-binding universal stress protein, UspA family n=1 Tax=Mycetocola miduiensis TaxID=995034 RepID=A0A1I4ZVY1_9MICO|nr:universal stress protein [Mycetocola miduiensis]SFN54386.1 Nucleotide-binding universal stress protein, UspA family [Mycetocola miduiensis]